jgi:hypothetical protein
MGSSAVPLAAQLRSVAAPALGVAKHRSTAAGWDGLDALPAARGAERPQDHLRRGGGRPAAGAGADAAAAGRGRRARQRDRQRQGRLEVWAAADADADDDGSSDAAAASCPAASAPLPPPAPCPHHHHHYHHLHNHNAGSWTPCPSRRASSRRSSTCASGTASRSPPRWRAATRATTSSCSRVGGVFCGGGGGGGGWVRLGPVLQGGWVCGHAPATGAGPGGAALQPCKACGCPSAEPHKHCCPLAPALQAPTPLSWWATRSRTWCSGWRSGGARSRAQRGGCW